MENILDRLSMFMIAKGLNNNKITNQANLSNGLLGNAFKVGKGLNSDSIEKILSAYPELNAEWFLTGKGLMLNKTETKVPESSSMMAAESPAEHNENWKEKYYQQLEKVAQLQEKIIELQDIIRRDSPQKDSTKKKVLIMEK
jgi:hypothetical protein